MPQVTIDGKIFDARPGETILSVCQRNGIDIPTLCYDKSLEPYGACRLCLVEVKMGSRVNLTTSCTMPVYDGMDVKTGSERVLRARRIVLELLLARAPASPELKAIAEKLGVSGTRFRINKDTDNKCILCGLCVRTCNLSTQAGAIGFKGRGEKRTVATPFNELSDVCLTCGACIGICPTNAIDLTKISPNTPQIIPNELNVGLNSRRSIYIRSPTAVPKKALIDPTTCLTLNGRNCWRCRSRCLANAIDFTQTEQHFTEKVGAIVVTTGYDLMEKQKLPEYIYGNPRDVVTAIEFERLLAASGPTGGEIRRPSDGKIPKEIVFIQCAGSRDPEHGVPYCSKICCMYTAKHALMYKHRVHDGQAYVFYIDIRATGKGYEEFIHRVMEEERVLYVRGKVSKVFKDGDKLTVYGVDTLTGKKVEIKADMVVLAMAIVPSHGIKELAQKLRISTDTFGFIKEAHPKLRPVETLTAGIYLAGAAQFPKDISDTVSQGSGAAAKVLALLSGEVEHEPVIAQVDKDVCSGCGNCANICAYQAVTLNEKTKLAEVNELICEGCGACAATCPSGAIQHKNFTRKQIFDMVDAVMGAWEE